MHDTTRSTRPVRRPAHHLGADRSRSARHPACVWLDRSLGSRCDASWRRLLERYGRRIRANIALVGRDHGLVLRRAEVEEMAQDLYLHWLRRGTSFRGRTFSQFWRFVKASIQHLVVDRIRSVRADKRSPVPHDWNAVQPLDDALGDDDVSELPASHLAWHSAWTPEDRLLAVEGYRLYQRRFLAACREVMPGDYEPEILAAILLDGHSSTELSRALARRGRRVRPSTLDSWVHKLRHRLDAEGFHLPRRCPEPEGAWPPRLPTAHLGDALESCAVRGPVRRPTVGRM